MQTVAENSYKNFPIDYHPNSTIQLRSLGVYEKNDLNIKWDNSDTEKVHLRFFKLYLSVNRKASNISCRNELGKYPLLITIKKNIINYFKHIFKLDDNSIV